MHDVVGAVLAGGRGTRIGMNKAAIMFEGKTLLERAIDLLYKVTGEVMVVGQTPSALAEHLTVRFVPDIFPGQGPLAGVHAALKAADGRACLIIPCDMPRLSHELLGELLAARDSRCQATAFRLPARTTMEPFPAIFEPTALPAVEGALKGGRLKVTDLLNQMEVRRVEFRPAEEWQLTNVNSPADLVALAAPH